jgi:TolB-like protein/DNA-binding winged helix-turn-helix (wHTH) protein/Tfp pilus assembly protein PilF
MSRMRERSEFAVSGRKGPLTEDQVYVKIIWLNNFNGFRVMQSHIWSFQSFELDSSRYELRHNGQPVRIERIPMELLILLISSDGQLVHRKEIVEKLWGPGVNVDSEQGINTAIRKLRQILGDDPENPKFIQTVVGKGYRFVGKVSSVQEVVAEAAVQEIPPVDTAAPLAQMPRRRPIWVALLAAIPILLLIGSWAYFRSTPIPASIAVLPFENLTGNANEEYLADGITDETISLFQNLNPSQLKVAGRISVLQYKGTRKPISEIAQELNVDLVVKGSLKEENGRVAIAAQLIRVRDQRPLWECSPNDDVNPVLTMQTNMASAIAEDRHLHFSPEFQARVDRARHIDREAHRMYYEGLSFWNLRDETSLERAIGSFRQAIDRVPDYAEAWAGLADAYSLLAYSNYRAPSDAFTSAQLAAEKAAQLDPLAAEPVASLGYLKLYSEWNFDGAASEMKQALELNPNYAQAHDWLGYVLTARENFKDANTEFLKALSLDPASVPIHTDLGFELHYSGDQPGAMKALNEALALNPRFPLAHFWRGRVYGMDNCENALNELALSEPALHEWQPWLAVKGHFLGKCGQREEAQKILDHFEELSKTRYVTSYGKALVYAGLGQKGDVLDALEKAYSPERSHWLVWLKLDPRFSTLHGEPRFEKLLHSIGLKN